MATDSLGSLKQRWEVCKWKKLSDISNSNGLRQEESCQSGGGERRRNSKQQANNLRRCFGSRIQDLPVLLPSQGQYGLQEAGRSLCVSGRLWAVNSRGYLIKKKWLFKTDLQSVLSHQGFCQRSSLFWSSPKLKLAFCW